MKGHILTTHPFLTCLSVSSKVEGNTPYCFLGWRAFPLGALRYVALDQLLIGDLINDVPVFSAPSPCREPHSFVC